MLASILENAAKQKFSIGEPVAFLPPMVDNTAQQGPESHGWPTDPDRFVKQPKYCLRGSLQEARK